MIYASLAPLLLIHRLAYSLDEWLYPSLRSTPIERPLFLVGLPRSGTTLLHRLVAANETAFTTMPLWELIFAPALCQKHLIAAIKRTDAILGSPLSRLIDWIQRRMTRQLDSIHATTLQSPEEDYLGLLPFGGCFLQVLARPHDPRTWQLAKFDDRLPERKRRLLLKAYRGILQRHLRFRGGNRRIVSKNPSLTCWLEALKEEFPDACMVGIRRHPSESLPSQLSSIKSGLSIFGHEASDPRIVNAFLDLYRTYWVTLDHYREAFRPENFLLVEYPDLKGDCTGTIEEIYRRFQYPYDDVEQSKLRSACTEAGKYKSQHRYDLNEFGLTVERINELIPSVNRGED